MLRKKNGNESFFSKTWNDGFYIWLYVYIYINIYNTMYTNIIFNCLTLSVNICHIGRTEDCTRHLEVYMLSSWFPSVPWYEGPSSCWQGWMSSLIADVKKVTLNHLALNYSNIIQYHFHRFLRWFIQFICQKNPWLYELAPKKSPGLRKTTKNTRKKHTHTHRHTQTHTDTHRHTQTHTDTHRHTQTHTDTHRHTQTHTDTHRHTQTHTDTHRHTQTHTDTHRHTQTHTDTHRHTQTHTDTHRHTHTHTHESSP